MSKLAVKTARITIRTFAEGLFSRLAHDLELECRKVSGTAEDLGAHLEVRIGDIDVHGTLKGGRVDTNGLSPSERQDALEKMHRDVFHTGKDGVVKVEATASGDEARVKIVPPKRPPIERTVKVKIDGQRISGAFTISLTAIGSDVVKGPMNAFRIKDAVEVAFDLEFQPA